MKVSVGTIQQHMKQLLEAFKHEESESIRRSGCEEEYDELEQLLTDIVERKDGKPQMSYVLSTHAS